MGPEAPFLPTLNACLNGTATLLLVLGLFSIRTGRRRLHATLMGLAALVSAAFLVSYLNYHFRVVPEVGHTPFRGTGIARPLYYGMLATHVVLAAVNLPMVLRTLFFAGRRDWARHRRLARWTWPVWFYVSVTGVLVYLCLYVWNPPAPVS